MYRDYFHIRPEKKLAGDFAQFRTGQVSMEAVCDTDFIKELCEEGKKTGKPWGIQGGGERKLDHGTMVPLYFINQYYQDYKLVSVGLSGLPLSEHYRLGQAIRRTCLLYTSSCV